MLILNIILVKEVFSLEAIFVTEQNESCLEIPTSLQQDTIPPDIQINNPKNQTYAASVWYCGLDSFYLNFNINEPVSWMGYSLDGNSNVTISGNVSVDTFVGNHFITVYANDSSGNMGKSDTIQFIIKSFPPSSSTDLFTDFKIILPFFSIFCGLLIISLMKRPKKD